MRFGKLLGACIWVESAKFSARLRRGLLPALLWLAAVLVARSIVSAASHNSHALDDTTAGTKTDADLNVLRCSLQRPKGYFFPRLRREKIRENVLKITMLFVKKSDIILIP